MGKARELSKGFASGGFEELQNAVNNRMTGSEYVGILRPDYIVPGQGGTRDMQRPAPITDRVQLFARTNNQLFTVDENDVVRSVGGPSLGNSSVVRTNAKVITEDVIFTGAENGVTVGPVEIAAGVVVDVAPGSTWVVL